MAALVRMKRAIERVITVDGKETVVEISPTGISLRRLGARRETAIPVKWSEVYREGGLLDSVELAARPLLAACVRRNCGGHHSQDVDG